MPASSAAAVYGPSQRSPLMKIVGVPLTPLRTPSMKSRRTLGEIAMLVQIAGEASPVQPEVIGVGQQIGELQRVLVREQRVVHLPELALRARRLGGLGGQPRVRVRLREREVAEHETHAVADGPLEPFELPEGRPQNGHSKSPYSSSVTGASAGPLHPVLRVDGPVERGHGLVLPLVRCGAFCRRSGGRELELLPVKRSSASSTPSAPGLSSIGETSLQKMRPSPSRTNSARSAVPMSSRYTS